MARIKVGLLGATGVVGQRYVELLAHHPWFEIAFLAASERSAGKAYRDALQNRWLITRPLPDSLMRMPVHPIAAIEQAKAHCSFLFSALESDVAQTFEPLYAAAGLPIVSNASAFRNAPDVPSLIPEINAAHLQIIPLQQKKRGWDKGFIAVKPNCSIQSYMTPLYALHSRFGLKRLIVSTLQAVSGAGIPGVSSMEIIDNIIPYIKGEEEKSEQEPLKILGAIEGEAIVPNPSIAIAAHCNRVPVTDGHMACVSAEFHTQPALNDVIDCWQTFKSLPQALNLPSAPPSPIIYLENCDRPQPRLDRATDNGMTVTVGRLRPCPVMHLRFVGLHHNAIRGAAGGGVLNAELLVAQGFIK